MIPKVDKDAIDSVTQEVNENPRVTCNENGTKTLELLEPIKDGNQEITELTFRLPCGRDWLETDKEEGAIGKSFRLAASLSGMKFGTICNMDGEDAMLCGTIASTMGKK